MYFFFHSQRKQNSDIVTYLQTYYLLKKKMFDSDVFFWRGGRIGNFFLNNHSKISLHDMQQWVVYIIHSFSSPTCMNVCMNAVSFVSICHTKKKTTTKTNNNKKKLFLRNKHTVFTMGGTVDSGSPLQLFMTGELQTCSYKSGTVLIDK